MSTKQMADQNSFTALQLEVNRVLAEELKAMRMDPPDVMAILEMLTVVENEEEIRILLISLSKKYPGLKRAFEGEEVAKRELTEERVAELVESLAKVDPGRAAELAAFTNDVAISEDDLKKEFPEVSELL